MKHLRADDFVPKGTRIYLDDRYYVVDQVDFAADTVLLKDEDTGTIDRKINMYGATPHVFRHSYISALAEAGVDLKTIQQISGHSNVTTTMGIYAHTRLGLVQEAGDKVSRLLQ